MSNNSKYWVVTDLDGTLMDENYDISPARKTLDSLSKLDIPVILAQVKQLLKLDFLGQKME